MRKRLGLSFEPGSRVGCLHHTLNIVIYSKCKKIVVLIKLTCSLEGCISTAHEFQKDRYLELLTNCRCNGWTACHFRVEVGSLGFVTLRLLVSKNLASQAIWQRKPETSVPRSLYVHPSPLPTMQNVHKFLNALVTLNIYPNKTCFTLIWLSLPSHTSRAVKVSRKSGICH